MQLVSGLWEVPVQRWPQLGGFPDCGAVLGGGGPAAQACPLAARIHLHHVHVLIMFIKTLSSQGWVHVEQV